MRNPLFIILFILLLHSCSRIEISENEQLWLLNEAAFTSYGFDFPDAPQGKYSKFKLPDGAIEIVYNYKGFAEDSSVLYISNTITIDKKESDAEETYLTKAESINLSKVFNSELTLLEGFSFGEESILYLWLTDHEPIGNYFQFRQNTITYQLLLQGFYFSDLESWIHFFENTIHPAISKMKED